MNLKWLNLFPPDFLLVLGTLAIAVGIPAGLILIGQLLQGQ